MANVLSIRARFLLCSGNRYKERRFRPAHPRGLKPVARYTISDAALSRDLLAIGMT